MSASPHNLRVLEHAVERYIERVKPSLSFDQAYVELDYLIKNEGIILDERPLWLNEVPDDAENYVRATAWVEIGQTGIVCPVCHRNVVTVMVRSSMSDEARKKRNARNRARRRARRNLRAQRSWLGESKPRYQ